MKKGSAPRHPDEASEALLDVILHGGGTVIPYENERIERVVACLLACQRESRQSDSSRRFERKNQRGRVEMSSWGPQIHPKKLEGTSLELQIDAKRLEGISLEPKIDPRRLEGSSLEVSWTKGMLQQGRSPRIRGLQDQGGASKNVFPKSPVRSPAKRVFTKDIFFRLSGWLVVAADGRKKVEVVFATWPCVFLKSKFSYGLIDICVKPFLGIAWKNS